MQLGGTMQGASTVPPRRRLVVLLAVGVLVATMTLVAVAGILVTIGGAEGAAYKAETEWVTLYDGEGIGHQVRLRTESAAQEEVPWVTFYDDEGSAHQVRVH